MSAMIRTAVCLTAVLLLSVSARAADAASGLLTLQDAIAATLEHNPELGGYALRQQVLAGETFTAGLRPARTFNTQLEDAGGSDDLRWVNSAELTLSLTSILEADDKRAARLGAVGARERELQSAQRVRTLDVLAALAQQYITLLALQEQQDLQDAALQQARQTRELLAAQVQAARTPEAELLRADAVLLQAGIARQATTQLLQAERIRLAAFWGETRPAFTRIDGALAALPAAPAPEALLQALDAHPDLQALLDLAAIEAAELRIAEAARRPDLQWTAGVRRLQSGSDTAFVLGVSVPLGSSERARGAIDAAHARQELAQLQHSNRRVQLEAALLALRDAYVAASDQFNATQTQVLPLLEAALAASETAFAQGASSFIELQLAQRQLLDARQALLALAAHAHSLAIDLERLSGATLTTEQP